MAQTVPVSILRTIGGFSFDAVFSETHEASLEVTDSPVETGVTVSDHAYMKPYKVSVQAGVSDLVIHSNAADPWGFSFSRSATAFQALLDLQRAAEPFSVQTGLKLYSNMVLTKLRAPQDKDTSTALIFTAELREVIIVSTQTVTYPPRASGSPTNQGGQVRRKGEQQGSQADSTKSQSLLSKLAGTP